MLPQLMKKLIAGDWVGPATAIGQDYKVLELKRVIEVKSLNNNLYLMRLLKKEVGQLALQALQEGDISEASLPNFGSAQLIKYGNPEYNREIIRRKQSHQSKNSIVNMLRTLRSK
ncbi:hypothetical protein [Herpetosiphon geysericola]|uniref:hypothetical protein n=1 Tax=Herpetosiphon geysericola TaxID=70996 RepID=UPI0006C8E64B|nr:hypothetical protein [Herpetosiphon geysericola]